MLTKISVYKTFLCAALYAVACLGGARAGHAVDADTVEALPERQLTPPPRLALPPRQCLDCPGPCAPAPCFDTHRGYLYYGTHPWDDDPVNAFNDCPGGRCGYPGALLSLHWIRAHSQRKPHLSHHPHHVQHAQHGTGCRHCQAAGQQPMPIITAGAALPMVERQEGEQR